MLSLFQSQYNDLKTAINLIEQGKIRQAIKYKSGAIAQCIAMLETLKV